jgi:2-oxoglutarate/2-oxoacid ferredoxin oxidoreductase subunit alpha
MAYEAARIALEYMTPVILLSDGYIANGAEPWLVPDWTQFPEIKTTLIDPAKNQDQPFKAYARDERLVRNWAIPGMAGFEHRLSGLEGDGDTGNISSDPDNHEKMTEIRNQKILNIANTIPELQVQGPEK